MLRFEGVVVKGCGRFSQELILPRRADLSVAIRDWPEEPVQGTLNVRIDRFPVDFLKHLGTPNVKHLDSRKFVPEAELDWREIGNNTLPPVRSIPDRGNAQIWRSMLRHANSGDVKLCWVLRRIGSGLGQELELVAGENLRAALGLKDGTLVEIDMEGRMT